MLTFSANWRAINKLAGMKLPYFIMGLLLSAALLTTAQQGGVKTSNKQLPITLYKTLRDSTTSLDIIVMQGKGGSMSIEGRNMRLFGNFFENKTSEKFTAPLGGNIMWQINGREFLSGNYYLGDSTGYVVFNKDGKEYVNLINNQGNSFFKGQIKH